jgi:pectin methylesterase-like acyl-CoA thioesterase
VTHPQFFSCRIIAAIALLLSATLPVAANTIRVPADQSTIQSAIDAASDGETILVSDGTYKENIDFKGKAITLKSVNGPATTIIDGGALDSVVRFTTNEALLLS